MTFFWKNLNGLCYFSPRHLHSQYKFVKNVLLSLSHFLLFQSIGGKWAFLTCAFFICICDGKCGYTMELFSSSFISLNFYARLKTLIKHKYLHFTAYMLFNKMVSEKCLKFDTDASCLFNARLYSTVSCPVSLLLSMQILFLSLMHRRTEIAT